MIFTKNPAKTGENFCFHSPRSFQLRVTNVLPLWGNVSKIIHKKSPENFRDFLSKYLCKIMHIKSLLLRRNKSKKRNGCMHDVTSSSFLFNDANISFFLKFETKIVIFRHNNRYLLIFRQKNNKNP